jgi:hypothetical protein
LVDDRAVRGRGSGHYSSGRIGGAMDQDEWPCHRSGSCLLVTNRAGGRQVATLRRRRLRAETAVVRPTSVPDTNVVGEQRAPARGTCVPLVAMVNRKWPPGAATVRPPTRLRAFDHGSPAGLESAKSETGPVRFRVRRLAERQPFVCLSARIASLNEETARSHEQEDVSAQEARAKARAWLHGPHGHEGRSPRARSSSSQGAKEALRLTAGRLE